MTRLLKLMISAAFHVVTTGISRASRTNRGQCVVLYYHAVEVAQQAAFARQMRELTRHCDPVSADAAHLAVPSTRSAAVTFDDGFRSVVEHALPVLSAAGIPSVVFLPSGNLGRPPGWDMKLGLPDAVEVVMSEDELRALPSDLVTVGSHSVTHPHLPQLDASEATAELADSRVALEAIIGRPVELFSFPYGGHSPELIERCRSVGYRRVFTSRPMPVRSGDDPFVVGRVAVGPDDWIWEFRLKLLGAYRWVPAASAVKRRLRRR